ISSEAGSMLSALAIEPGSSSASSSSCSWEREASSLKARNFSTSRPGSSRTVGTGGSGKVDRSEISTPKILVSFWTMISRTCTRLSRSISSAQVPLWPIIKDSSSCERPACSLRSRKRTPSTRYSCICIVPFRLVEISPFASQGSIPCIARAFEGRLRRVRIARQLRPPDEEDLQEILAEVLPDLGPVGGLQSYDHYGVHADGFGQLFLRHEHPLPRSR